jgi:hypothetical protein
MSSTKPAKEHEGKQGRRLGLNTPNARMFLIRELARTIKYGKIYKKAILTN